MVTLRNAGLLAFETVARVKTVHAAAAEIGLTQAAVTKRLRALETEIGVSLFLRSRRGMTLTSEGEALLRFCKVTAEAEGELIANLSGSRRQETALTIAGPTSAMSTRIADACTPLYAKHPFLRLHLRTEDHANLIEAVKRGEADIAVVSPPLVPNEMQSKMLKPDRYFLVASAKWQNRELKEILREERILDFYESDETTLRYLREFQLEKFVGRTRLFANENEILLRYLSEGVGFGTLTESVARPYLENGKLIRLNRGQSLEEPLAIAWYARSKKQDYFQDVIRAIK